MKLKKHHALTALAAAAFLTVMPASLTAQDAEPAAVLDEAEQETEATEQEEQPAPETESEAAAPEQTTAPEQAAAQQTPAQETVPADGMYTMFHQVFTGNAFKKIEINLMAEEFILVSSGSDSTMLEIKSNIKEKVPVVTQDGKSLKVQQKDKKANMLAGRICTVKLTLPQNLPPSELVISVSEGNLTLEPVAASSIKITTGTGSLTAGKIRADKDLTLAIGDGRASADAVEAQTLIVTGKKGNITLKGVLAPKFSVSMDKGAASVSMVKPFSQQSSVEVNTGSIDLSLPASAVFYSSITAGKGNYHAEFYTDSKGPELKVKFAKGNIKVSKQ